MKLTEREMQSLVSGKRAAEADLKAERLKSRGLEERVRQREDMIASLNDQVRTLREENARQLEKIESMVRQMVDFMMGKGPASIENELRKAVEKAIRAEYEKKMSDLSETNQALRMEIARLRNQGGGNTPPSKGGSPGQCSSSMEQQNRDLRTQAYGKKSEKSGTVQASVQMSADEMDLEGMDASELEIEEGAAIAMAAAMLTWPKAKPGPKGQRSPHPASLHSYDALVIEPDYVPEGAKLIAQKDEEDAVVKIYWIEGHVRVVKIKRPKYYKDGRHYQAPAPKFLLGNTQIDISFLVHLLEMFVVQKVTIGTIEEWIADQGLRFDHSTVIGWIRKAADLLEPIDGPLHDAITAEDNNHVDESTIRVCDTALNAAKVESEELEVELSPEEEARLAALNEKHYFIRWVFAFMAPRIGLVQYNVHNRGSRKGDAVDEYYEDVGHKIYLHTDGAKMYDKYDKILGYLVKIGCLVHVRRHFFRLKGNSEDAAYFVDKLDEFFHVIAAIKKRTDDIEERKRQQLLEGLPLLHEVKKEMELLLSTLDKATSPDLFKALAYALKELPSVMRAFERGDLEFSNNVCEQQMRRIAIYRNNSLHCGSVESTVRWARLQSIAQSCRNNGKNFKRYVREVLTAILTTPKELITEKLSAMLPHHWVDPMPYAMPSTLLEPTDEQLVFAKNI